MLEPPILELSSTGGIEDMPVAITLSASVAGDNTTIKDGLVIHVTQFPQGSAFNKGVFNGSVWIFNSTEFGETELSLPEHFSGSIVLMTVASSGGVSREGTLGITVEAVADPPTLMVGEACYDPGLGGVNLTIESSLVDQDGSESLMIVVTNVPDTATLLGGQKNDNGDYSVLLRELPELFIEITIGGELVPFSVTVSASSMEKMNSDVAYTNVTLFINFCDFIGKSP